LPSIAARRRGTEVPPPDRVHAGLLTPLGRGGISLVSVVGPGAVEAVWALFRPTSQVAADEVTPGKLYYGHVFDREGGLIDEVLVAALSLDPGHVEVNCHGGVVSSQRVLRELARSGAEVVSWSELPSAACLTPCADRIQREALDALVRAPSRRTAQILSAQWQGALSGEVHALLEVLHAADGRATATLGDVAGRVQSLLSTARWGLALTEPPKVVLGGRVNVGKSSLANVLHRAERYLVDERAGTTRDLLPGLITVDGLAAELIDAAGIRETEDTVEKLAVQHTRRGIREAELVVVVFDGSRALVPEERDFVAWLGKQPRLAVVNKCDRPAALSDDEVRELLGERPVHTSAVTGVGVSALREAIGRRLFGGVPQKTCGPVVFTRRQVKLLTEAHRAFEEAHSEGCRRAREALQALLE